MTIFLPGRPLAAPASTRVYTEGVAVVMPAYQEEENLGETVEDFLMTLQGMEHRIVVVNDGSDDGTGRVLDDLVALYPDRVIAVHHETNMGYGAAVRTGIATALAQTDMRRVLLTDSDGQFKGEDLLTFLEVQQQERADGVIGYRRKRADPLIRKVNAWIWTQISRLLLHTRSRDVDCAYKLLDRKLLDGLALKGEAAAISPELVAKISAGHTRIVEYPVNHYPRQHGHQTGAAFSVIVRSLRSLAVVYRDLVRDGHKWRRTRKILRPDDPVLALVTVAAVLLSVGAVVHYAAQGVLLSYADAVSHVLISRRVIDSPTPGVAQLGGVWLPLPHILTLPFVWIEGLYRTGLASSLVSMISYVVTTRYLYKIATLMAGTRWAGVAAAAVFGLNANVLYLQATPMTETLLFAGIAGAVYHTQEWCRTGRYGQLALASVWTVVATLTRYEGWVLCLSVTFVVGYTALRRWRGYSRIESHLIFFGVVAFSGIFAWLGWNALIMGDPLYWQAGEYAKPSLWVSDADKTVGDVLISARTYLTAMLNDMGPLTLGLASAGLILYVLRNRLTAATSAPYALLGFLPFYVYTLYAGQRPLHVVEIHGDLYNVRFGLVMALASAVFAAYLVRLVPLALRQTKVACGVIAVGVAASVAGIQGVATLEEPVKYFKSDSTRTDAIAADWLAGHYDGGLVLMENFGNELATFKSGLPLGEIVYEGSFRRWEPALRDPAKERIRWVYMRSSAGAEDGVHRALHGTQRLNTGYALLYEDADRKIYRAIRPVQNVEATP